MLSLSLGATGAIEEGARWRSVTLISEGGER